MAFIEPMHRNKSNITYLLTVLKLDNDPIQYVKEVKFLGLIWDTKLTFEPHIEYLKARCQKSINILKVLSRTEWGADQTTLLKLYRSLVRSKLDYGCLVYGSASKTALAKLILSIIKASALVLEHFALHLLKVCMLKLMNLH